MLPREGERTREPLWTEIRRAEEDPDLSRLRELVESLEVLRLRDPLVVLVRVVDVDVVGPQAAQRSVDRRADVRARQTRMRLPLPHLRPDDDALAMTARGESRSDDLLRLAAVSPRNPSRTYVSGVDRAATTRHERVEDVERILLLDSPAEDVPPPARHSLQLLLSWRGSPRSRPSRSTARTPDLDPAPRRARATDVPPTTKQLAEGAKTAAAVGGGARDGKNDHGHSGWTGPCPPKGRHRYFHKVYALDTMLPDLGQPTKAELERAMSGHVIAKGEVVGTYQKQPK